MNELFYPFEGIKLASIMPMKTEKGERYEKSRYSYFSDS